MFHISVRSSFVTFFAPTYVYIYKLQRDFIFETQAQRW